MELFDTLPTRGPSEMSKSAFSAHIGVSKSRISQLIRDGLPVLPNGRIPVEAAELWYQANVRHSAQSARKAADELAKVKREREEAHRDLLRLQVEEKAGRMIDKREVERAVFELARAERDSWLAWCSRVAPLLAGDLGCDLSKVYAALDRAVRQHLLELSADQLAELPNA